MNKDNVINQWDIVAKNYALEQQNSINSIVNRTIIKELLGDINDKTLLDAGCGFGLFSNELKSLGANVFAFDGSKNFIEIARENYKNINFDVLNIKEKLPYNSNFFDIVISSLVLMDIDNIEIFFSEAHRILKEDGKLVFSIVHPSFFQADWEKDEQGNKLVKRISNYWNKNSEILDIWGETTHYHRPLTYYSKIIKKHGFVIEEMRENPENSEIFNQMKSHQKRIPLFLCFSLKKYK